MMNRKFTPRLHISQITVVSATHTHTNIVDLFNPVRNTNRAPHWTKKLVGKLLSGSGSHYQKRVQSYIPPLAVFRSKTEIF